MKRRMFLRLIAGAASASFAGRAHAQAATRVAAIGVLHTGAVSPSPEEFLKQLRDSLAALNLVEGRNVRFELRSAGGRATLPQQAAELVALKVDVIVAHLTPAAQAAKQATTEIPIVMAGVGDPLGTGLVESLAHPGGNVTGYSTASAEVAGKSVELIHEIFPMVRRIAILSNETDPFSKPFIAQIQQNAGRVGLETIPIVLQPDAPQEPAFQAMHAKDAGAVIVQGSIMRPQTIELATQYRLPSLGSIASWPRQGGLMSYSADPSEMYRAVAKYIDDIIKGRKPADLPVALPTTFDLVLNTRTARAIGANIPVSFLARATEVIE